MDTEKFERLKDFFTIEANPEKVTTFMDIADVYMGRRHYRPDKNERNIQDKILLNCQLHGLLYRMHQPPVTPENETILQNSFRYACTKGRSVNPLFINAAALAAAMSKHDARYMVQDMKYMRKLKRAFHLAIDHSFSARRGLLKPRIEEYEKYEPQPSVQPAARPMNLAA